MEQNKKLEFQKVYIETRTILKKLEYKTLTIDEFQRFSQILEKMGVDLISDLKAHTSFTNAVDYIENIKDTDSIEYMTITARLRAYGGKLIKVLEKFQLDAVPA